MGPSYNLIDDYDTRLATVQVVGDADGNIATSVLSAFQDKLVGYNLVTGTYTLTGETSLKLTIDADISRVAYEALAGRDGFVCVYNYETGDILCAVSTPTFDPMDPPELTEDDQSGIYINKVFSATQTPGSTFKLLTAAAAIENVPGIEDWSYYCVGTRDVYGEKITCTYAHGQVDFDRALAVSCNCGFSQMSEMIGPGVFQDYVDKTGLTKSYTIDDNIHTEPGTFEFPSDADLNLGWAGIGQWNDQVNPCAMMVYMGAIASGDGKAASPRILQATLPVVKHTDQMILSETAARLQAMMKNDVLTTYGEENYPGLDLYAKSGTAEVYGKEPHAWFTGFIKNPDHPYAFVVCVENGGFGSEVAGPVANAVLQEAVKP